nr:J84 [uncultured bacterium]
MAENKAIATVSQTIESSAAAGDKNPSAAIENNNPIWVITIQPRRRPSGGT